MWNSVHCKHSQLLARTVLPFYLNQTNDKIAKEVDAKHEDLLKAWEVMLGARVVSLSVLLLWQVLQSGTKGSEECFRAGRRGMGWRIIGTFHWCSWRVKKKPRAGEGLPANLCQQLPNPLEHPHPRNQKWITKRMPLHRTVSFTAIVECWYGWYMLVPWLFVMCVFLNIYVCKNIYIYICMCMYR